MENDDRILRKAVGKLIEVPHGEYSDTRDLAVVQLALLGRKAVPYILTFLKKEGELEQDFIDYDAISNRYRHVHAEYITDWRHEGVPRPDKEEEEFDKFCQYFKKKWGWSIRDEHLPSRDTERFDRRKRAVDGALEALAIIGHLGVIPTLKAFPIHDWEIDGIFDDVGPLFENVKKTIGKIQSI